MSIRSPVQPLPTPTTPVNASPVRIPGGILATKSKQLVDEMKPKSAKVFRFEEGTKKKDGVYDNVREIWIHG